AMKMTVRIGHTRARAGPGRTADARAELEALLERHLPSGHLASLVSIHRTLAEIALAADEGPAFEKHLAEMRRWALPTKNPALIAQCDQLRNARAAAGGWG